MATKHKPTKKTYSINSFGDIANVITPENLDNFMTDLRGSLIAYLTMVEITRAQLSPEFANVPNNDIVPFYGLYWTDDGKHDIILTLTEK